MEEPGKENGKKSKSDMDSFAALRQLLDNIVRLDNNEWEAFHTLFTTARLQKGDYFAVENRIETRIGFLVTGVVRAFYRNDEGMEYNKTFFTSHEFFGAYASIVSNQPNRIHVQALTDCDILEATYADFKALFPRYRKIETLARVIAELFYIEKEKREIELVMLTGQQRYELFREEYPSLENIIPQYHIASYLGITPTQLSRIRAKRS